MRSVLLKAHDGEHRTPDLERLLEGAARGEDAAWTELLGLYGRRVYALVRSRCGSEELAEEITQGVFVSVATKMREGSYTERGRFESWLFRIAMNRVRDVARAKKRRKTTGLESAADVRAPEGDAGAAGGARGGASGGASPGELAHLRAALESLSEPDREVIELRHHAGMGFKEMAELLGEPMGTLLARHHRALRKLKDGLTKRGVLGPDEEG